MQAAKPSAARRRASPRAAIDVRRLGGPGACARLRRRRRRPRGGRSAGVSDAAVRGPRGASQRGNRSSSAPERLARGRRNDRPGLRRSVPPPVAFLELRRRKLSPRGIACADAAVFLRRRGPRKLSRVGRRSAAGPAGSLRGRRRRNVSPEGMRAACEFDARAGRRRRRGKRISRLPAQRRWRWRPRGAPAT